MNRAVFIDKDGTLIKDVPYNVDPSFISLEKGVEEGLGLLASEDLLLVVISNQSGVAQGFFEEAELEQVSNKLSELTSDIGAKISGFYYCPHYKNGNVEKYSIDCDCRKPKAGLLLEAAKKLEINLQQSWMIGDILNDVEAGNSAGCKTILINNGGETEWIMNDQRKPSFIVQNFKEAAEIIIANLVTPSNYSSNAAME